MTQKNGINSLPPELTQSLAVVIPAYNAAGTIGEVVKATRRYIDFVVVVDNNSKDDTAYAARASGATVVTCTEQGAGAATRKGLATCVPSSEAVITMDSDGQHNPHDLVLLISLYQILKHQYQTPGLPPLGIIIGSRFAPGTRARAGQARLPLPAYRKLGIDIINLAYNLGLPRALRLYDTQSGYRIYTRAFLDRLTIRENQFAFSVETLVKARAYGFSIHEVPVSLVYHKALAQNSSWGGFWGPIRQGFTVLEALIRWRLTLGA